MNKRMKFVIAIAIALILLSPTLLLAQGDLTFEELAELVQSLQNDQWSLWAWVDELEFRLDDVETTLTEDITVEGYDELWGWVDELWAWVDDIEIRLLDIEERTQSGSFAPTATPGPPTPPPASLSSTVAYGIRITLEKRCEQYNSADYGFSQSIEQEIVDLMGGLIYSPYTGTYFGSMEDSDIEHIVDPSEARDSGLCSASREMQRAFSRDLDNLTLAEPQLNRHEKNGNDLGEWLPPLNRCWFANQVVLVKRKYGLTWDMDEANAARSVLKDCTSTAMIFAVGPEATPVLTPTPVSSQ